MRGLSGSLARGVSPARDHPCPLHQAGEVSTTGPPGHSVSSLLTRMPVILDSGLP